MVKGVNNNWEWVVVLNTLNTIYKGVYYHSFLQDFYQNKDNSCSSKITQFVIALTLNLIQGPFGLSFYGSKIENKAFLDIFKT